jgi:uncharacterized membrane protein
MGVAFQSVRSQNDEKRGIKQYALNTLAPDLVLLSQHINCRHTRAPEQMLRSPPAPTTSLSRSMLKAAVSINQSQSPVTRPDFHFSSIWSKAEVSCFQPVDSWRANIRATQADTTPATQNVDSQWISPRVTLLLLLEMPPSINTTTPTWNSSDGTAMLICKNKSMRKHIHHAVVARVARAICE